MHQQKSHIKENLLISYINYYEKVESTWKCIKKRRIKNLPKNAKNFCDATIKGIRDFFGKSLFRFYLISDNSNTNLYIKKQKVYLKIKMILLIKKKIQRIKKKIQMNQTQIILKKIKKRLWMSFCKIKKMLNCRRIR